MFLGGGGGGISFFPSDFIDPSLEPILASLCDDTLTSPVDLGLSPVLLDCLRTTSSVGDWGGDCGGVWVGVFTTGDDGGVSICSFVTCGMGDELVGGGGEDMPGGGDCDGPVAMGLSGGGGELTVWDECVIFVGVQPSQLNFPEGGGNSCSGPASSRLGLMVARGLDIARLTVLSLETGLSGCSGCCD